MEITSYGHDIFVELGRLHTAIFGVISDNSRHNERVAQRHEDTKERTLALLREAHPQISVEFTGPDPASENSEYTAYLNRSISEMALCRSVDCYHWYLRQVVLLILGGQPSLLSGWAKELGIKNVDQLNAFERGENREQLLINWFRGREWRTRQLVHKHWQMPLKEDLGVLVSVRNCIVHQLGRDVEGTLGPMLCQNSRLSLSVLNGSVVVTPDAAMGAIEVALGDLSIIDQMLAKVFSLPVVPVAFPRMHRTY